MNESFYLKDLQIAVQKVRLKLSKYRNSLYYRTVLPGPYLFIGNIENEFNQNSNTKKLFKYLDWDKREIHLSNSIYCITLSLGLFSTLSWIISFLGFNWLLPTIPLFVLSVHVQFGLFSYILESASTNIQNWLVLLEILLNRGEN